MSAPLKPKLSHLPFSLCAVLCALTHLTSIFKRHHPYFIELFQVRTAMFLRCLPWPTHPRTQIPSHKRDEMAVTAGAKRRCGKRSCRRRICCAWCADAKRADRDALQWHIDCFVRHIVASQRSTVTHNSKVELAVDHILHRQSGVECSMAPQWDGSKWFIRNMCVRYLMLSPTECALCEVRSKDACSQRCEPRRNLRLRMGILTLQRILEGEWLAVTHQQYRISLTFTAENNAAECAILASQLPNVTVSGMGVRRRAVDAHWPCQVGIFPPCNMRRVGLVSEQFPLLARGVAGCLLK